MKIEVNWSFLFNTEKSREKQRKAEFEKIKELKKEGKRDREKTKNGKVVKRYSDKMAK